jgi:rhamnogalacturonyl hydrolase YesR
MESTLRGFKTNALNYKLLNKGNMKKWVAFTILMTCLLQTEAQSIPNKKVLLTNMQKANQYFMDKWPDAGKTIITNKERQSTIWTRSVYYEGLMALYTIDAQKTYYDYAVQWGDKHNWKLVWGANIRNADNHCAGQTYIDLYLIDKQPERIKDIKASIDLMVQSDKKDDWSWVDALQMAMPVFTKLGVLYNDSSYFTKMYELYSFAKNNHGTNGLYNKQEHLWWRDKDFVPPYQEPNGKNCYWSRGNGWALAALARTINELPKSNSHYNEYLKDFIDLSEALLPLQRTDGFWNVSLQDPSHFEGKETSGTALFAYGFAWGVNHGILNKKKYLPAIVKAWNGMATYALHENGALGYVQSTGKEPKDGQPVSFDHFPDFEDYGLGAFLLAGTEIYKMK